MRTDEGKFKALADIKAFKRKQIALWGSIPCAGGSPLQYVSEAHYSRRGDHRSLRKLRGSRTDFRYLLGSFMEVARAVLEAGGTVCSEWPCQCQCWRDTQVKASVR
eukprot:4797348-Pyramimonas_sp.AAC.1